MTRSLDNLTNLQTAKPTKISRTNLKSSSFPKHSSCYVCGLTKKKEKLIYNFGHFMALDWHMSILNTHNVINIFNLNFISESINKFEKNNSNFSEYIQEK